MSRKHSPSKLSQAITRRNGSKYSVLGNGHHCLKSCTGSHWWQIGSPDGIVSVGVCKYCGEERQFANTVDAVFNTEVER